MVPKWVCLPAIQIAADDLATISHTGYAEKLLKQIHLTELSYLVLQTFREP